MDLPSSTLRDLALVGTLMASTALDHAKAWLGTLLPHMAPPDDLTLTSTRGSSYSGVVLIERSEIIAGLVIRVEHDTIGRSSALPRSSSALAPWTRGDIPT